MKKLITAVLFAATLASFTGCLKKKTINVQTPDDLKGLSIGVQTGTTGETYVQDVENAERHSFKTGIDAALALKNGNIDAIVLDELPAKEIVSNNDDLMIVETEFSKEFYSIAVQKGNKPLLNSINSTIRKLKESGDFDKITAAYIPSDGQEVSILEVPLTGSNGTLKMGTNAAFPPFEFKNGESVVGFDAALCSYIANDMDKKLEIMDMNFDSLIAALQSGTVDMVAAGMTATDERRQSVDFSDPYYESKQVIIIRNPDAQNITAFNPAKLSKTIFSVMISKDRWLLVLHGLQTTLEIAFFAVLIGSVLGCIFALFKISNSKALRFIANLYTTVIRGIPMATQLMIFYFVIFAQTIISTNAVLVAIIAFGINSGAYCTEIFRAGIQGVDAGQMEAGRSLGLSWSQTMRKIILPQAFRTVLPTYTSEFIALIKETSVASFIAVIDLQKSCDDIRNQTYNAWIPLISCALIYLILTIGLTKLFAVIEKRMAKSDRS